MKKCRFNDPVLIASWFDGTLEPAAREEYSRHLLACRECADAVLHLERDLFLMETADFARSPRYLAREKIVFRLCERGLELVRRIGVSPIPLAVEPAAVRGEGSGGYLFERKGVRVELRPGKNGTLVLCVIGGEGAALMLYREGRLVEARSRAAAQLTIADLPKGKYILVLKGLGSFEFEVE